jgi:predicted dehydrogenase
MDTHPRFRAAAIGNTGHVDMAGAYRGLAGGHGLHLPYQHLPGVEMVAVADADAEACERGRLEAGAARGYADYREMLAVERPDIVSICSRHAERHEEMVMAAAAAGAHIYVDKPFAPDLASADRMLAACAGASVRLAVAHQSRFVEPFLTARRLLAEGEIGTLQAMIGRGKEDHRGGGEDLMCCGVHTLDAMRFLAGDPQWVQAYCSTGGRALQRRDAYRGSDHNGLVGGDSVHATFGFANSVVGTAISRRDSHHHGDRWGLTLVGSAGVISLRYGDFDRRTALRISKSASVPEEADAFVEIDPPFEPVVPGSAYLESVHMPTRGNRLAVWDLLTAQHPAATGEDGRWTIEMMHGIYASHLARQRLNLPLIDRRHPFASYEL